VLYTGSVAVMVDPGSRMRPDEVLAGIENVAREHVDFDGHLRREMRLVEDLELDSLGALTLAVEVENRFRIRLEPEVEAEIETVGDLVDVVGRLLAD
jgi:acyl carrier protein